MNILKQIPNAFTLGNLVCGVLAILNIFDSEPETAFYLILLAAVLDFFDGFLARLFKVSGELGKQLDSLSDLVTFGVAPSLMLYSLAEDIDGYYRYAFLLIAVFSSYRLAKFNIDTRQTKNFIGVPTPITGIMCMSWAVIDAPVRDMLFSSGIWFLMFNAVAAYLLVSEIKLPSLKFKKGPLSDYYQHLVLLLTGIVAAVFFGWLCIPIIYSAYVLSSILFNFAEKSTK